MKEYTASEFQDILRRLKNNDPTLTQLTVFQEKLTRNDEDLKDLFTVLKENKTLRELRLFLSGKEVSKELMGTLNESMETNKTLIYSNLDNLGYESFEVKEIIWKIEDKIRNNVLLQENRSIAQKVESSLVKLRNNNPELTNLCFQRNEIGIENVKALAEVLKFNTTLTELDLSENQLDYEGSPFSFKPYEGPIFGDEGAKAFAAVLKVNTTLKTLELGTNQIRDKGIKALAKALKSNQTLTCLKLDGNHISEKSVIEIAKALEKNQTLTELDLSGAVTGVKGIQSIEKALKFNDKLLFLNLNFVRATDTNDKELVSQIEVRVDKINAAQFLRRLKINDPKLTQLNLSKKNQIDFNLVEGIFKTLHTNNVLTHLRLGHKKLSNVEVEFIAESLKINSTLVNLDLIYTEIDDQGIEILAEGLKSNKSLTFLNLSNNCITDKGAKALIEVLKINKKLVILDLGGNHQISYQLVKEIDSLIEENTRIQKSLEQKEGSAEKIPQKPTKLVNEEKKSPTFPNSQPSPETKKELNPSGNNTFINMQETVVSKEDLALIKNQIIKQSAEIDDINSLLDQDPNTKSEMSVIRNNTILNSFYLTLFRNLNQTFNAVIVASSDKVQINNSTGAITSAGVGAAVTYGVTKIGTEFLQGFPIANVLGKLASKTVDFAMNRRLMMDMRHLSKIAQTEEKDPAALSRLIARKITLGMREELLNPNLNCSQSKLSESAKQIKAKILEVVKGENRTPTERRAMEKVAEIFAFLITENSKNLTAPNTTIVQVADAICNELGISQTSSAATNAPVNIKVVTATAKATVSSPSPSTQPLVAAAIIDPQEFIAMQQTMKELLKQREQDAEEIEKLKKAVSDKEDRKPKAELEDENELVQSIKIKPGMTEEEAQREFDVVADKNTKIILAIMDEKFSKESERTDNLENWQDRVRARENRSKKKINDCAIS